jgi:hypothetical protein
MYCVLLVNHLMPDPLPIPGPRGHFWDFSDKLKCTHLRGFMHSCGKVGGYHCSLRCHAHMVLTAKIIFCPDWQGPSYWHLADYRRTEYNKYMYAFGKEVIGSETHMRTCLAVKELMKTPSNFQCVFQPKTLPQPQCMHCYHLATFIMCDWGKPIYLVSSTIGTYWKTQKYFSHVIRDTFPGAIIFPVWDPAQKG